MKNTLILSYCILALVAIGVSAGSADDTKPTFTLRSRREPGQTDKVVVLLEVGGEFKDRVEGKQQRVAMSGVANLTYYEMTLEAGPGRLRSVRYYEQAEAAAKFKDGAHAPSLGAQRRLVGVAVDPPAVTLFSLREPLTQDELEVIDVLGNSLLLDKLLPGGPVAVGDSWAPAEKVVAALLGLNGATRCKVRCVLKEVTPTAARVELAGGVEGPVNDTLARVKLKGKYRFDRRTNRIDWFALLTKEDRGISQVAVGFDVVVRFQMTVAPQQSSPELTEAKLDGLGLEPTPKLSRLTFQSPQDHWRITYDRCWHLGSDDRERAMLKLIRQGALTGQCNVSSLPRHEPDKLVSLEEFQGDVRRALGKNFGEFVEAGQSVDPSGHRVLRVVVHGVVHGKSADVSIRWIYYHVADRQGRQAAFTFTVEQELVERFADADKPIVRSLRFAEPTADGKNEKRQPV